MRRCGNCANYTKLRNRAVAGLCDKHDWACDPGYGRRCQDHKNLKYNRIKAKAL